MPSFHPDSDIPDLSGKVILVTGANIGLGKETVLQLSKHKPAQIFLAARSKEKALAAIEDIRQAVPDAAPITFLPLDLTSFESIKTAAASFQTQSTQLHLLINNAGIMMTPAGLTKEGYEIQFGTNHMGHALLTKLLLPTLKKTAAAATTPPADVRVITLSSGAEAMGTAKYDFGQLKTDMASSMTATRYGISKLANVHFARELARRNPDIRSISVHPGVVNTNLTSSLKSNWPIFRPLMYLSSFFFVNVSKGAQNQLWAAISPDAKSGEFYHPVGVLGKGSQRSKDDALAKELWEWTEKELEAHL